MKRRINEFCQELRAAGIRISTSEVLDALAAVAVIGIERERFREALAAALIKDEADRAAFDATFERFFALSISHRRKQKPRPREESEPGGAVGQGGAAGSRTPQRPDERQEPKRPTQAPRNDPRERESPRAKTGSSERLARRRQLLNRKFSEMTPDEATECALLAEQLARQLQAHRRRRFAAKARGRLDLRRTMRRSLSFGGVPLQPAFRNPRPGRPDLVALCDLSHSVATAAEFLLSLLRPAPLHFRRARFFGYVDRAIEIELVGKDVIGSEPIDRFARSDFGKVLEGFWRTQTRWLGRSTSLLILGDARNNRRPPRADLLRRMERQVGEVIWLNPESPRRWNSGDSVMNAYAPSCRAVLAAETPAQLVRALRTLS